MAHWVEGWLLCFHHQGKFAHDDLIMVFCSTTICYAMTVKNIQPLAASVLIERTNLNIGFATFWKTGYCLAIFGEANCDNLKKSARHSQYSKDSATYAKDAEVLLQNNIWQILCP